MHRDRHDVALVLLQGAFSVNGRRIEAPAVVYMEGGARHDMANHDGAAARYLAFEFQN